MKALMLLLAAALAGCTSPPPPAAPPVDEAHLGPITTAERIERGRNRVLLEDPRLLLRFVSGTTFGGRSSRAAAMHMFSRDADAIADVIDKTEVLSIAPRTWLVRMPIVNAVLFETAEGLLVVDTGYGPAGPALLKAIRSVSRAPIHTIVYTHGHVDHAYGTWALLEAGEHPQIVAQEGIEARFDRYIALRGSLAKYMSQPQDELPASRADIAWPTRLFRDELTLTLGGESFVLRHHRGETDDQLYVWAPARKALASADYYQGFLPNAGNGKRSQRYVGDWSAALREMATLGAEHLLPAHGAPIDGRDTIRVELQILADALEHIRQEVISGLNRGLSHDQVVQSITWPERFSRHPSLAITYVTPRDIARMVLKEYTGWWDDVPSHWSPPPLATQGKAIVALAGGMAPFLARVRETARSDLPTACILIDWAFYAEPDNADVADLAIELYGRRIRDDATPTQEALAYLDHIALIRALQQARER